MKERTIRLLRVEFGILLFLTQFPRRKGNLRNEFGKNTKEPGFECHYSGLNNLVLTSKKLTVDEETVLLPKLNFVPFEASQSGHNFVYLGGREHEQAPPPLNEGVE